ncbi:3-keto-5-aminohexanoate cleavage protein [Allonocardiopsis opalescens]|uniref:Uncharacterized protein (DUF849 family) n=1 Tax=Allonocardiopsis opalescens TaxID=1144618 RepID=A0A2T0Q9S2_9ACTN|nr:3-keto-5-aminohexanoate cleavage protein [Allonocardiopsis opalescens]PRY00646.1 uncharacterized protein (DUF849 family) [Allonocardiopsis opalescens]
MRIVACLNGSRSTGEHPSVPVAPRQLADDARAAVDAGATEVHLHPRGEDGAESLEPQAVAAAVAAVRAAVPGVVVGVTTSLSAEPDPLRRYDLINRWSELPDLASVNMHEPGSAEVVRELLDRRVGIEAGLWTPDAARILLASGLAGEVGAVLVEPMDPEPERALAAAAEIDRLLDARGVRAPRLLHGTGAAAWPLLAAAVEQGRDIRIGLEDVLTEPSGARADGNAALVRLAVARAAEAGRARLS